MARSKSKPLPKFESLDELVEFFDTHDLGEYWDQMPEVHFEVDIKTSKHLVAIDEETITRLNEIAKSKKVSTEKLINDWLKKRVAASEQVNKQIQPHLLGIFVGDFRQAREFAAYILKKELYGNQSKTSLQKLVGLAFNTSLIISYSRPFKQKKSSLEQYVDTILNEDETKLHEQVIKRRDEAFGHSDKSSHLIGSIDYNIKPNSIKKYPFLPFSKLETEKLKNMIEKWIDYFRGEQAKLRRS